MEANSIPTHSHTLCHSGNRSAAIEDDAAEALLTSNPHLLAYRPALKNMCHEDVVGNEISHRGNSSSKI